MASGDKRIERLQAALASLRRKKNVQNRQLRLLLGDEGFAQFEDEWRQQTELRKALRDKPAEIVEYEERLKKADFAYAKADAASRRGSRSAAKALFATADTQFERLAEYLQEQIAGRGELGMWLDRDVHFDASNAPSLTPTSFPRIVTSRSLHNRGGGLLAMKCTKRQVKMDAVERALDELKAGALDEEDLAGTLAAKRNLLKRLAD